MMSNSACLERRRDLVLHDLDRTRFPYRLDPFLQGLDASDVEPRVELERSTTRHCLRVAEHDVDRLAHLVREDRDRPRSQRAALVRRRPSARRSGSGDLERLLTVVGLRHEQLLDVDADPACVCVSIACSASMKA
jgi:hypothetical protein